MMQTNELRAELAELARDVDPFPDDLAAIRRRVARRRVALGSIATVVVLALVASVVIVTRSTPSRIQVAGSVKESTIEKLPRLDAVVVLPAIATSADAARVQLILDRTTAVERYAPVPVGARASVLFFAGDGSTAGLARACAARSYAVELTRTVRHPLPQLTAAIGTHATVRSFGHADVDVEVFMLVHATSAAVAAVRTRIAHDPDVTKTTFLDHQAAYREFKKLFANEPVLIENTTAGSLPESFRLQVGDPALRYAVAQRYRGSPGVNAVIEASNPASLAQPFSGAGSRLICTPKP